MNNIQFRAQRDVGGNISAGINFYRTYFKEFFPMLIKYVLPIIIVGGIITFYYQQSTIDNIRQGNGILGALNNAFSPLYFLLLLVNLVTSTLMALLILNFVKQKSIDQFSKVDESALLKVSLADVLKLLFIGLGIGLIVGVASIFLVIPGIYLAVIFSLCYPIFVMEKGKYDNVFSRALQLIKGKWWNVFGFLFLLVILIYAISILFALPSLIYGGLKGWAMASSDPENFDSLSTNRDYLLILLALIPKLGALLTTPIAVICLSFQYFSLVEEKENVGLFDTISQINKVDE